MAQRTIKRALKLFIFTGAMVNIVSMATEETLIAHYSSEVRQTKYLVQRLPGKLSVVKGILVPNMNFVRLGTSKLLSFSLLPW